MDADAYPFKALAGNPRMPKCSEGSEGRIAIHCEDVVMRLHRPVRRSPYGFSTRNTEIDAREKKKFRVFQKKYSNPKKHLQNNGKNAIIF